MVVAALNHRKYLPTIMIVNVLGFEQIKHEYVYDKDFVTIY